MGAIAPTLFGLRCSGVTVFLVRLSVFCAEFSGRGWCRCHCEVSVILFPTLISALSGINFCTNKLSLSLFVHLVLRRCVRGRDFNSFSCAR